MSLRQRGPALVLLAALALSAAGCGLDPRHAPVDAKKKDFCAAYRRVAASGLATSAGDMKDYLNELARFGTPRGIPTAARNGYEYLIGPDNDITSGAAFGQLATQPSAAGQDAAALKEYTASVCAQ